MTGGCVFPTRVGMFRAPSAAAVVAAGFPHTRGDVPNRTASAPVSIAFSPHAWGCSARSTWQRCRRSVFPTRVGMFRGKRTARARVDGFPHTRGDVPYDEHVTLSCTVFSPHAWGCSAFHLPDAVGVDVFPTRVGMFRRGPCRSRSCSCFPHTRGDVPTAVMFWTLLVVFSPHAWGCSGNRHGRGARHDVFPTRVGMFRVHGVHRRDDAAFSPHAWGCSELEKEKRHGSNVFPTRVGMFRTAPRPRQCPSSFPHTRGDVPTFSTLSAPSSTFSPHAWGCSVHLQGRRRIQGVFPTRVGMFRSTNSHCRRRHGFPHTRGDVPFPE